MDLIIRKITSEFVEIIPKSSSIFFHKTFLNPLKRSLLSLLNRLYHLWKTKKKWVESDSVASIFKKSEIHILEKVLRTYFG